MRLLLSIIFLTLMVTGCGSTKNKGGLEAENTNLRNQVAKANQENSQLKAENTLLTRKIETLNNVISVLDTEKTSRVEESSVLRSEVRKFVQNEIDALKSFLVAGGLLDFVGGELVERSSTEDKALTLVDLANRIKSAGVLTGMGAYVMKPTTVKVKILRNIENQLIIVWESSAIQMKTVGPNRHEFTNTVGVEKGDVIAYEFSQNVGVGFSQGTADTRYSNSKLDLGASIRLNSLMGSKEKRAYSIGVYGLLNQ